MTVKTRPGLLLIISSPSGAGKSTLCSHLRREEGDRLWTSVSATTRERRKNEVEGQDYYFVSHDKFQRMQKGGEFLEHAEVFGNFYGTPGEPVEKRLNAGIDVLFDIDWQGAQQIRSNAEDARVISIFILPPSMAALEHRLRHRAQDSEETVQFRMSRAHEEISHWEDYDYVLVNDDLDACFKRLHAILTAERVRAEKEYAIKDLAISLIRK
ncbi:MULTISPECIES: guanylate kinase [unclassified Iodidimonas]|jgi:guanylate kinase|uniref:guanylate kinase n=1 Tax=unclassified Iodidimonas TaxID=2626145 RepID=UPI0024822691|nr:MULTISPECIES: guanylate kinase [unclassified Iodidimonas]